MIRHRLRRLITVNLWKDIPAGDKPPELMNVVIEVVMGSRDKFEYNIQWEAFVLDRIIPSSVVSRWTMVLCHERGMMMATLLT